MSVTGSTTDVRSSIRGFWLACATFGNAVIELEQDVPPDFGAIFGSYGKRGGQVPLRYGSIRAV